ncbi:hypothetical protein ACI2IX_06170 [Leifsonia aquatica]|uniref:hypothetical protein n=1 Tax=Leifsonia aquatica TaxID=144185 RepID=UPI00384C4E59
MRVDTRRERGALLMKMKRRLLSLHDVVSYRAELREGDELFEIIDDTADYFRQVLVRNGYYITGPIATRSRDCEGLLINRSEYGALWLPIAEVMRRS